jgi:HlyD family secretion protein
MTTEIVEIEKYHRIIAVAPSDSEADKAPIEARFGWYTVLAFFGLFLGFACFIRLDAAAYAEGSVKVAGNRQVVQHRDGGIVSAIHVREGQKVKTGQILVELAGGEVAANERALAAQVIGLQAERARLIAERTGAAGITPPAGFAVLTGANAEDAKQALALQTNELAARRRAVSSQKSVLAQQTAQLNQKIGGFGEQIVANKRQVELYNDELDGMRKLAEKGFASINRVRALERAQVAVSGDIANLSAASASTREQIGETRMQALTLDSQQLQQVSEQLRQVEAGLNDSLPKWQSARKQLEDTRIRATATGQVVGLEVFTVGGVVGAGQKLMEIVPDAAPLVIEMMVSPNDADDVHVGQVAEVRFLSLHERTLPVIEGKVTRLSADAFLDERTGAHYYTGQVTVSPEDIAEVARIKGEGEGIKPGLPVQVLIPLRKRTLLQYLVEPLNQALWRSGREH